jgi:stage II sporulation protein D
VLQRPQVADRTPQVGLVLLAAVLVLSGAWPQAGPHVVAAAGLPPSLAYRIVDLSSGRAVAAAREDVLRTPVLPGSILKIATLIAALESGTIAPSTRIPCPRRLEVDGHRLDCSHPDLGRPLGPAEALAHSCNGYFVDVARRLRRESLDRALVELGLPPSSPSASVASSALGLDGLRVAPEQLLSAFVRLATSNPGRLPASVRSVVLEGLRGAAEFGTAAAFHDRGVSALAKTGTAPMPGGGYEGLVVAVTPADRPRRAIVALAPGAAGMDAARLAADALSLAGTRGVSPPAVRADGPGSRSPGLTGPREIRVGVTRRDGGYDAVAVPLEEYVSRVVSAESEPAGGPEALKALAVVVRTFALRNVSRHARDGFDLCDLTHCQVLGTASAASDAAARATAGQVIVHDGRVADVYYTASCGGHTERPTGAWPGAADPPYLLARPEPECDAKDRWVSDVTAADLVRALVASGRRGTQLRDLVVVGRSASGRAAALRADGLAPPEITGGEMRMAVGRTLGWQVLKSTRFDLERTASGYRFTGSGRGHGVGLCVAGSGRMAAAGQSAGAIIGRYFPGTTVLTTAAAPQPGSTPRFELSLPVTEAKERSRIEEVGRAALREYSARLGVPAPPVIRIVAHPSVEAYLRASGQPWWTTGSTAGRRIDLIPLASLRQRGLVESTLRHELAHVITADRLAARSVWVREAVAMDLAGDARFARPSLDGAKLVAAEPSCPTDAEWRALGSADALQQAYRRAAACYAAQRSIGRRWDEVR